MTALSSCLCWDEGLRRCRLREKRSGTGLEWSCALLQRSRWILTLGDFDVLLVSMTISLGCPHVLSSSSGYFYPLAADPMEGMDNAPVIYGGKHVDE